MQKKVSLDTNIIIFKTKIDQMFLQLNSMEMQLYIGYSGWLITTLQYIMTSLNHKEY